MEPTIQPEAMTNEQLLQEIERLTEALRTTCNGNKVAVVVMASLVHAFMVLEQEIEDDNFDSARLKKLYILTNKTIKTFVTVGLAGIGGALEVNKIH